MTQPAVPVCYRHSSRETYLRCSRCDRPICPDCMHDAAVGHHCPECVAEGRRTQRQGRTAFGGALDGQGSPVTKILIAINAAVAVGVAAATGGAGLTGWTAVHGWGAMHPASVAVFSEYYRLLTSMFLHFGVFHLVLNMFALWVVGGALEPLLGRARFLALYLLSGLGGSVAVYLFGGFYTPSVGASGAVFGLFAAFYILMRRLGRDTSMITIVLVVNLILTFMIGALSIWGHLGGLIIGAIVALGLAYAPRQHRAAVQWSVVGAVAGLLAVLTLIRTATIML